MESVVLNADIFFYMWILDPILTLADENLFLSILVRSDSF